MNEHMRLMLPGPTPIPPSAQAALARPMINHRGPEFAELFGRCMDGVRWLYQTEGDIALLPASSGTGSLEAAVVNVLSPGDAVLALVAIVAFFLLQANRNEAIQTEAVSSAASSVADSASTAAESVSGAASQAADAVTPPAPSN